MAIIAPLFAFIGRFVGRLVNLAFGWATVMPFGRVPESKKLLLSGVALGSMHAMTATGSAPWPSSAS